MNLETMRLLVSKGLTAEDLLEVAESMAVRVDKTAAERQARHRAKVKAESVTRDVTRDSNGDTPALSPSPNENNSNPHPHTHPEKKTRAREAQRMPADWQPGPLPVELAEAVSAWAPGSLEREMSRFRDWAASASGPNAKKSNWDAAWRNWIRKRDDERSPADRRSPSGNQADNRTPFQRVCDERIFGSGSGAVG